MGQSEHSAAGTSLPQDSYEGRLTIIFEIVREAGVNGISCAAVAELVPWKTDTDEIRAKLMSLRSRDCVWYWSDMKKWRA